MRFLDGGRFMVGARALAGAQRTISHKRRVALAAGLACAASGIAFAQDKTSANAAEAPAEQTIVVTANKRRQTLESVPLAVSAISGSQLAESGVYTPQDLTNAIPNVQNGVAGFAIRGVASGDWGEKGDPSTAFSLDGIFIARPQIQTLGMFDLERVEVLRGPQGTLYGRNATAGAVNVLTARPRFETQAAAGFDIGNHGTLRFNAMYNTALSDSSALRIAASTNRHAGYTDTQDGSKALDSRGDRAVRLRYLNELSDKTSALVTLDYASESDSGPARLSVDRATSGDRSRYYQNPGVDGRYKLKTGGLTLELNSETGFGTITSLTGYRKTTVDGNQLFADAPGVVGDEVWDHKQFSQELRLTSKGSSPLQWVTGLYYFDETTVTTPVVHLTFIPADLSWDLVAKARSAAAFAQATYSVLPDFRVVGGLRYTRDSKQRDGTTTQFGFTQPYAAEVSYGKASWKAGVEYDLPNKALLYASVSTGYKAGSFNDGTAASNSALYYKAENLTSYEAGLKGRFLDKQLYLSSSVFHYDYRDMQLNSVVPTIGSVTQNAAKSTVDGVEVEGKWRITPADNLDFNAAALRARYKDYAPNAALDWSGKPLDRSPDFTLRLGYSHDFKLGAGILTAGIAAKYSASYVVSNLSSDNGAVPTQYRQDAFTRTDLNLTYRPAGDRWSVSAYVRNLENKRQLGNFMFGTFTITDPRQFGVRGQFSF